MHAEHLDFEPVEVFNSDVILTFRHRALFVGRYVSATVDATAARIVFESCRPPPRTPLSRLSDGHRKDVVAIIDLGSRPAVIHQ